MELWLVLVQPVLEWHVAFIVSHFCQYSGGWRWACTILWRHGVLACASKSYMCFLLSLWSWASLLASLSLSPTHVKHEDTLSNREDSVRCKCTALIASHRETPPGEFRASHFLPLLSSFTNFSLHPFLWDSARLETLRDEHVQTPQCSREDPLPNLKWREFQLQKTVQFTVCFFFLSMLYSFTNIDYRWPVSSAILNVFVHGRGGHHTT